MSPQFYVNNLVVLPLESSELARKKVQTPFYIPCSRHTLYRYIICFTDSFVCKSFLNFWIGTTNIFLEKTVPTISIHDLTWVLVQISDVSQERGSGRCILDQIKTCMFCPSILPLKMVEYPAVARWCVQEPTYAKYRHIYVIQPFKLNYVVKIWCLWRHPKGRASRVSSCKTQAMSKGIFFYIKT